MRKENKSAYPQHSLLKSILLHILPGALATIAFLVLKPLINSSGYPPLAAFLLAVLLVDLPVMVGILLYEGKKRSGALSLDSVILFREKVSWKVFALVFIVAFILLFGLTTLVTPITGLLTDTVFSGLPDWIFLEEQTQYESFGKRELIIVFVFQLVLTGIILPWFEELYFRGYLMPRISRYGWWAPLISGLLFGLYHSWQLFGFATVFLLGTALGYIVWWKRDIRLSISLHIFANTLARLMFLLAAIQM